jgi:hypothetical protein
MVNLGRVFAVGLAAFAACFLLPSASALAASPADWLYEPTTFTEVRLEIPEPGYKELEKDPKLAYKPATFSIAETNGLPGGAGAFSAPIPIEVKLKGSLGSLRSINQKAAFKLKFKKSQPYLGLQKMTLNNMVQDPSMIHEAVVYDAFHAMAVPAPHVGFTYLTVNGKSYGLHLNIETQDKVSMEKLFGTPFVKPPQHVYEGEYGADVSKAILPLGSEERWKYFQVDEGEEEDRADLAALVTATDGTGKPFADRVKDLADLPEMTRMWAVEKFAGHWDGYAGRSPDDTHPNNYYLYSDAAGKFSMMPSGTDQTWSDKLSFSAPGGHLFERCLEKDSGCQPLYRQADEQLLSTLTVASLDKDARCMAAAVNPWREYEETASEPQKQPMYGESTPNAQKAMRKFISERPTELATYLGVAAPPKTTDASACPPLRPIGVFPPALEPPPAVPAPPAPPAPESTQSGGSEKGGAAPVSQPILSLGRRNTSGGAVGLHLHVSGPGTVTLLGTYGLGAGRRDPACRGSATATAGGELEARCKLTPAFRRRLADRATRLHVAVTLATAGGTVTSSFPARLPRR